MTKKSLLAIILLIIVAVASYWYFAMRPRMTETTTESPASSGFSPFGRNPTSTGGGTQTTGGTTGQATSTTTPVAAIKIPTLRLLSNTPVGGYAASTTASTTVMRWVDRGRGNIYEAHGNDLDIVTLSNTVVPKVYESVWNKTATSFIASIFDENNHSSAVYADIKARVIPKLATTTSATSTTTVSPSAQPLTPYELKGKNVPGNLITYASSPKKDKLFLLMKEGDDAVGYTSTFDGKALTKIFTSPVTQVTVEWPEDKTIAITTKASADAAGYLYFIDPATGIWRKVLGPLPGLTTRVSTDAKRVFVSIAGTGGTVLSSIYDVAKSSGIDAVIRTLADKCVWGNFYKEMLYCAVPAQPVTATYPGDWYLGNISTVDKIWQVNASTGELHLVSNIIDTSDRVIDAFHLGLDAKDDFLLFMNKNDLSLWSLDLVSSN